MSLFAQENTWQSGGQLYTYEISTGAVAPVQIDWRSSKPMAAARFEESPSEFLEEYDLHPDGHSLTVIVRGQAFEMGLFRGPAAALGGGAGTRCRALAYLHDGRPMYFASGMVDSVRLIMHGNDAMRTAHLIDTRWGERPYVDERDREAAGKPGQHADLGSISEIVACPSRSAVVVCNERLQLLLIELGEQVEETGVEDEKARKKRLRKERKQKRMNKKRGIAEQAEKDPYVGSVTLLATASCDPGFGEIAWSPLGEWIAYSERTSEVTSVINIQAVKSFPTPVLSPSAAESGQKDDEEKEETGVKKAGAAEAAAAEAALVESPAAQVAEPPFRRYQVSCGRFESTNPTWDPQMRYLHFLSTRDFKAVADEVQFSYGFPAATRPYLLTLKKTTPNPFIMAPRAPGQDEHDDDDDDLEESDWDDTDSDDERQHEEEDEAGPRELIDVDGLTDRLAAFPVPVGVYGNLAGVSCDDSYGKVTYCRTAVKGYGGVEGAVDSKNDADSDDKEGGTLYAFSFSTLKESRLAEDVAGVVLSQDRKTMLLHDSDGTLKAYAAGEELPDSDDEESGLEQGGEVELDDRVSLEVEPLCEFMQMFHDAWDALRLRSWDKSLGGADWDGIRALYGALLPSVATRAELDDVLAEMHAELGWSHVVSRGGDYRGYTNGNQGCLGADTVWDPERRAHRVSHLVRGDAWEEGRGGPLARLGINVSNGDFLVSINHSRLTEHISPGRALANHAGKEVYVAVVSAEDVAKAEAVLASEKDSDAAQLAEADLMALIGDDAPSSHAKKQPQQGIKSDAEKAALARTRRLANAKKANAQPKAKTKVCALQLRSQQAARVQGAYMGPVVDGPDTVIGWLVRETARNTARRLKAAAGDAKILKGIPEGPIRQLRVKAVEAEVIRAARYRDWVERNTARVDDWGGGKIGYVHVPDMDLIGLAEFHRYYLAQTERKQGVVLDVRWNAGGNVSELLLDKLLRRPLGYGLPRYGRALTYPSHSLAGPIAMLADENTCSDGDMLAHYFQAMGLGPLVGQRTWGGVLAQDSVSLVDGTEIGYPADGHFSFSNGWDLENQGASPNAPVDYAPHDWREGHDPQLRRAVDELQTLMAAHEKVQDDVAARIRARALPSVARLGKPPKTKRGPWRAPVLL